MKTWDKDPAIEASLKAEKKDPLWEIVNCGIWFPTQFSFGIGMKDPSGTPLKAGSIELLWRGLEYLNEVNWGASVRRHRRVARPPDSAKPIPSKPRRNSASLSFTTCADSRANIACR